MRSLDDGRLWHLFGVDWTAATIVLTALVASLVLCQWPLLGGTGEQGQPLPICLKVNTWASTPCINSFQLRLCSHALASAWGTEIDSRTEMLVGFIPLALLQIKRRQAKFNQQLAAN
jgi:hypothetical protein